MQKNDAGWKIEHEELYETFPIFNIRKSTRINPRTNKPFDFFLMDGFDWCNIIALTPENSVVLVRQYRHGAEEFTLEIPGGVVEANDVDPMQSALREMEEETGYTSSDVISLGTIYPNPAMQSMRLHCYLARNARRVKEPVLDPGEDIEVVIKPLEEVMGLIQHGAVTHALVLAAFGLYGVREGFAN